MSFALLFAIAGLTSTGFYLITSRSLSRIVLGFSLLGHASVLGLLLSGGGAGKAPLANQTETAEMANPIPQALSLTAIVISFGLTLFLLALARRQQVLTGDDLVEDDLEDRRIAEEVDDELAEREAQALAEHEAEELAEREAQALAEHEAEESADGQETAHTKTDAGATDADPSDADPSSSDVEADLRQPETARRAEALERRRLAKPKVQKP